MKTGSNSTIYSRAKICYPENVFLGDHVTIDDFVFIVAKKLVKIGNYVHIASFASITGGGVFVMGDYSTLSSGARIFTGTEDLSGMAGATIPEPYRKARRSYVTIGKHCMVGANSVILPGVTIPDGVVIGAMSLVLENTKLKPWSIYVGSPARWLKYRQREPIQKLQAQLEERNG